jgi:hypothetical protein
MRGIGYRQEGSAAVNVNFLAKMCLPSLDENVYQNTNIYTHLLLLLKSICVEGEAGSRVVQEFLAFILHFPLRGRQEPPPRARRQDQMP